MDSKLRTEIAGIAGALISNRAVAAVCDNDSGQHVPLSVKMTPGKLDLYSYDRNNHLTGTEISSGYSIFNHETGHHVRLTIRGNRFEGYDNGTASSFTGTVSGKSVTLYDPAAGEGFRYSF